MEFKVIYLSDTGLRRKNNEDYLGFIPVLADEKMDNTSGKYISDSEVVLVVCDGMGGLEAGEIASKETTEFALKYFRENLPNSTDYLRMLNNCLVQANFNLLDIQKKHNLTNAMGTTIVMAVIFENNCYIGWVGDSRAYLIRENKLIPLTKDHSKVQDMLDNGLISEEEAFYSDEGHIITQSIGQPYDLIPGTMNLPLEIGDKILLCTDGVCGEIPNIEIEKCVIESNNELDIIENIKSKVYDVYANDNLSMIIYSFLDYNSLNVRQTHFSEIPESKVPSKNAYENPKTNSIKIGKKSSRGVNPSMIVLFSIVLIIGVALSFYYYSWIPNNSPKDKIKTKNTDTIQTNYNGNTDTPNHYLAPKIGNIDLINTIDGVKSKFKNNIKTTENKPNKSDEIEKIQNDSISEVPNGLKLN